MENWETKDQKKATKLREALRWVRTRAETRGQFSSHVQLAFVPGLVATVSQQSFPDSRFSYVTLKHQDSLILSPAMGHYTHHQHEVKTVEQFQI